jgi:hypothetical protein
MLLAYLFSAPIGRIHIAACRTPWLFTGITDKRKVQENALQSSAEVLDN